MMKNLFVNAIKAALVALPLIGVLSSCDKTKPNEPDPAKASVTVTVKSRATGADLTSSATIEVVSSTSTAAVSGNVITLTGNKDIPAQTVSVKATANGKSATSDVLVGAVAAGNVYQTSAVIVIDDTTSPEPPTPDEKVAAKATITVSVIDVATSKDVTASSKLTASVSGAAQLQENGNVFILTGDKDIAAQTLEVNATYGSATGACQYEVPAVPANTTYEGTLYVYVSTATGGGDTPDPAKDPAKATITVTVKDHTAGDADVTKDSKISVVSSVADAKVELVENVITITGAKDIATQTLTITVEHKSGTAVQKFTVGAIPAGKVYNAGVTIYVGQVPGTTTITYYEEFVRDANTYSNPYYLTNSHASHISHVSHTGVARMWIYNDTEYFFESTESYPYYVGSYVEDFDKLTDENVIKCAKLYNDGIEKKTGKYDLKASAWSMYTLFVIVETKTAEYKVVKKTVTSTGNVTLEDYSKFNVVSKHTNLYYEEQAVAGGHGSHYEHGHGHGTHGGGENAGGGIVIPD